ncbi:MAG: primosomal protein N' [Aerococcus sp.]|nr:primosomal protein N' [Aerococcus sp.]
MSETLINNQPPLYARVIVDVPTQQTDHPFDYEIPEALCSLIQCGMRVQVPFGVRELQGFVVDLADETDFSGDIKPITRLLDEEPVLTPELLDLARDMATSLFTFQIKAMQAMLPGMLKVAYHKYFIPTEQLTLKHRKIYFHMADQVSWEEAEETGQIEKLLQLKDHGEVRIHYTVEDQKNVQTEKWIQPLLPAVKLEEKKSTLSKNAKKQQLLLDILIALDGQRLKVSVLTQEYALSMATIKRLEEKGWLKLFDVIVDRDPYADREHATPKPKSLQSQQQDAYDRVSEAIDQHQDQTFLLQGVTGSGKTEVYLQLIQRVRERGEDAILLVPEISLTPQMVEQMKARFGSEVAVLHSRLSVGEHFDEWRKMKEGRAHIVVGARSSIFAPFEHVGLIVIDEEHETTYKQQNDPRYDARNIAKWRGHYHHCPVLLGSATPSLESRARAQNQRYELLLMPKRTNQQPLPAVSVVDMREEYKKKNYHTFSRALRDAIMEAVSAGHQVALLLNRRGYANYVMCRDCGHVFMCKNCSVALTYHYQDRMMRCHYCGYSEPIPQRCPNCHGQHLRDFGTGTERVEQELQELFPAYRVARMDNDTTRKKNAYEKILRKVQDQKVDILLGTQMIAKGLDFPNITLVGVLNADTALYLPDFRSAERTFQLLTQVSGRAGRGEEMGRVIFQTFNPEHYAIQAAKDQDYDAFYQQEMRYRKLNRYSPYFFTVRFTISHFDEADALKAATTLAKVLREDAKGSSDRVIGPSQSAIARMKNRYYFQILYQYRDPNRMQQMLSNLRETAQEWGLQHIYLAIDVEPQHFI